MNATKANGNRLARWVSRTVRAAVGLVGHSCPIVEVDGFDPPRREGRAGRFTTPGGRPVYHPNAYRRAWGKPVYHRSTLRIVVGRGWLAERLTAVEGGLR